MRAMFRWYNSSKPRPKYGDQRIVTKFVFCRTINGETRSFGFEDIKQEAYKGVGHIPESRVTYDVLRWKDVEWVHPWP